MIERIINQGEEYDLIVMDENFGSGKTQGSSAIRRLCESWAAKAVKSPVVISWTSTPEELSQMGVDAIWDKQLPDNIEDIQAQLASLLRVG